MKHASHRLQGRSALVVGGGQSAGGTVGNGRATAVTFASEGARVMVADRDLASAQETVSMIRSEGGQAVSTEVDVTDESSIEAMVQETRSELGSIDVLHNNVGVSLAGGDAMLPDIEWSALERINRINLTGMIITCKHVLPVMRDQSAGVILSIGSVASQIDYPYIAYKTSKAGVVALMENIAIREAKYGIRSNAILPGLMDTPMAIENRIGLGGMSRDDVVSQRNQRVPLKSKMGSGWDVANAALFLASEEASFVTGVALTVDGGQSLMVG